MCYEGGPRCANHVQQQLNKARESVNEASSEDEYAKSYEVREQLEMEYNSTPTGQKALQRKIDVLRKVGRNQEAESLENILESAKALREYDMGERDKRIELEKRQRLHQGYNLSKVPSPSRILKRTPLKELDSAMLAITLVDETKDLHMSGKVREAMTLASHLHSEQTRSVRGKLETTPYIEHPLRNAVRLIRLGCKDEKIINATLLHDVVEDCSQKYVAEYTGKEGTGEEESRRILLGHISKEFSPEVSRIVKAVSNDITPENMSREEKVARYHKHVSEAIHNDTPVFFVKLTDFMDNAGSMHYQAKPDDEKFMNRALKYKPMVSVFRKELDNIDRNKVSEEGIRKIRKSLDLLESRLTALINSYKRK